MKNMSEIRKLDRTRLPCLRKVEKAKLLTEIRKVNDFLNRTSEWSFNDVTEDNDLFYIGVALVNKVFEKNKTNGAKKQPWWERRLESPVKELKKDLGRLDALLEGKKMKKKHQDNLQTRYKLNEKGNPKVKEKMLLGIKVKSSKINRYQ